MKGPVVTKLAGDMMAPDGLRRDRAAEQLDELLAQGKDLSAAVPILSPRILEIDRRVQPTVLALLAKEMKRADFAALIQGPISAINSKDRNERRTAADVLLAWTTRDEITPQEVHLALAHALRHKDKVLRDHVAQNYWNHAALAPDFSALMPVLLKAYGIDHELDDWVDMAFESAAKRNIDIGAALPALTKRVKSPRSGTALTAMIAYHVHRNNVDQATALYRKHGGDAYVCQEIGQRACPARPSAGVAILCLGLEHAGFECRYYAALGLQRYAEAELDISAALPALEKALADAALFRLARSTPGEQAARTLVAAAKQKRLRRRVLEILQRVQQSGGKTARSYASAAFAKLIA